MYRHRISLVRLAREHPSLFVFAAVLGAVALWHDGKEVQRARDSRAEPVLTELKAFVRVPLTRLDVIPHPTSHAVFAYSTAADDQLSLFREAAERADAKPVSGHSGAIFEAELILENPDGKIRFLATVHEREPLDLFLEPASLLEKHAGRKLLARHLSSDQTAGIR
jgi:hypothetical protein